MKTIAMFVVVLFGSASGAFSPVTQPPRMGGEDTAPAPVPLGGGSCSCPEVRCTQGTVAACSVSCTDPKIPVCQCDAGCNSANGNTSGSNRCFCQ